MTLRRMTVVRAPSTNGKPMIRIVNNQLTKVGFEIGTPITVTYEWGIITIKKINHENRLLAQKIPVADSNGGEEDGH
jgi:hypothetical protein